MNLSKKYRNKKNAEKIRQDKSPPYLIMRRSAQQVPRLSKALNQTGSLPNPSGKTRKPILRRTIKSRARKYPELVSPNLSKKRSEPPRIKWSKPEDKRSHSHPVQTDNCRSGNVLCTPSQGLNTYRQRRLYPSCISKGSSDPSERAITSKNQCPRHSGR